MSALADFMKAYAGDREVITVDIAGREGAGQSPFIVVQWGRFAAVLNPMAIGAPDAPDRYLDVDVHTFVDDGNGSAAVFGMTRGRRHDAFVEPTGQTSRGAHSAQLVVLMIGEQEAG